MKRLMLFSLALIVTLASVVTSPLQRVAAADSLANFFPAETFAFADLDTADLPTTIKTLSDLLTTIDPRIPANWADMLSEQASQQAGRPVTFEKDVIGWIGSRVAVGVVIPAETFKATLLGRSNGVDLPKTQVAGLIAVKDEALADAFLKLSRYTALPDQAAPINGEAVTLYADTSSMRVARWKGYLAIGDVDLVLDTQRLKKATLALDSNYQKMVATLKPGTLASVFIRTPFAANSSYVLILGLLGPAIGNVFTNIISGLQGTPTPTPSPTPQPSTDEDTFANAVFTLGMGIHSVRSEGKNLILDSSTWLNPDAVQQLEQVLKIPALTSLLTTDPKPLTGTLVDKIPASATAVLLGTDIKQIYDVTLGFAAAVTAAQQLIGPQHKIDGDTLGLFKAQLGLGLRGALGVSLDDDLLPWMDGDFAVYMTPNKAGMLNLLSRGQFPADSTILITASDTAKAQSVLTALNETLSQQANLKPANPDAKGLYTIDLAPGNGLSFGLLDDIVLLTPSTGVNVATAALAGDGVLSSDATWSSAAQLLPEQYSQVWYLNAAHLRSFVAAIDTSASASMTAQLEQLNMLAAPFESALVYYRAAGDGIGETSFILTLK